MKIEHAYKYPNMVIVSLINITLIQLQTETFVNSKINNVGNMTISRGPNSF